MALKWGIVSTGNISNDFVCSLKLLPSDEHQIIAVAATDLERSKKFADLHKITKSYGSYKDLAQDKEIGLY